MHRYKIEAKNGELKNIHGYGSAISYGIENMQMQGSLTIFAVNLKRFLKSKKETQHLLVKSLFKNHFSRN